MEWNAPSLKLFYGCLLIVSPPDYQCGAKKTSMTNV